MEHRGTETTGAIERRLRRAEQELSQRGNHDQVVVNDDEDRVVAEIRGLIEKELSQRRMPRSVPTKSTRPHNQQSKQDQSQ